MRASLPRSYLGLATQLYRDATARVRRHPNFTHLLDHALLSLEFRRALGAEADVADPAESFRQAVAALGGEPEAGPWLYRGAAQAGWLAAQLAAGGGGPRPVCALPAIDDVVLGWLLDYPDDADVDLPRGVLGLGVYALHHPDPGTSDKLAGAVLDVLERRVERDATGIFIRMARSPERQQDGSADCRIVGMAHGTAGLVAFLSLAVLTRTRLADRVQPLLTGALAWLLGQRVDVGHGVFPHRVELAETSARPTWCSGDPGIGIALELAARAAGSGAARQTAEHVAARVLARPAADCGVVDACLCHGAAGLCWYGHRLHVRSQHPGAERLVRQWADWIADRRKGGRLRYFSPWGMIRDPSFLEGDAGVALVLLQAATGGPASWPQLLLAGPDSGG